MIAVIVPCYNEEQSVPSFYKEATKVLNSMDCPYEIIFVNDGSKDKTPDLLREYSKKDENVKFLSFSRNFGKESVIYAGLERAYNDNCDCAVVIDCDLQHPPEKIPEMYNLWKNDYEVVECVKNSRGKEGVLHKISAALFYSIISKSIGIDMRKASDYKLMDRKVIESILNVKEKDAFFRAISSWVGFRSVQIPFDVSDRQSGESKWSTKSLIKYAFNNITAFSYFPLRLVTVFGILSEVAMIVLLVISLISKTMNTVTVCLLMQLLLNGIIMLALGIEGYYISKINTEVKNRPKYIISETEKNYEDNQ